MAAVTNVQLPPGVCLPPGAWDSHVHVVDEDRFPFAVESMYRPGKADLNDLFKFERNIGTENVCLVCISVYGSDNTLMLEALKALRGSARAIIALENDTISKQDVGELHSLGVRGVRVNLKTTGTRPSQRDLISRLSSIADQIRSHDWSIQIYLGLDQVDMIAAVIPRLDIKIVIDHMASPDPRLKASSQRGYHALLQLLRRGLVWVKLSGTYRFSDLPDLDEYAKALITAGSDRVIWASDWPHTGGDRHERAGANAPVQDYRQIDDAAFVKKCFEWCDFDQDLIEKLFVENPKRLWS